MVPAIKKGHISTIALWHYYTLLIVNTVCYNELYHRWEGQEHNYLQFIILVYFFYLVFTKPAKWKLQEHLHEIRGRNNINLYLKKPENKINKNVKQNNFKY